MDADDYEDAGRQVALALRGGARGLAGLMRQAGRAWALTVQPWRSEVGLARRRSAIMTVATRRGLLLGLPEASTGRPRSLDYAELSVLLASGVSHAEAGRRMGVSRSAVSKAWHRNRELRRRVNRVEHAAFG